MGIIVFLDVGGLDSNNDIIYYHSKKEYCMSIKYHMKYEYRMVDGGTKPHKKVSHKKKYQFLSDMGPPYVAFPPTIWNNALATKRALKNKFEVMGQIFYIHYDAIYVGMCISAGA